MRSITRKQQGGSRLARGESSLINRKARRTAARFVSGYVGRRLGVDGLQKHAEKIGNQPVLCLFLSLSSPLIFRAGADPQKLPHSRNTRFPRGIGGRKLLITCGAAEKKERRVDRDYIKKKRGRVAVLRRSRNVIYILARRRDDAVVDV